MAEQYAILVAGQSQGAKIGEITKFEDKCPDVSPRNPATYARSATVSKSHKQDTFTMPGTWPTKYQSFSVRGTGTTAVMRLTPYNPTASYFEGQDVGATAAYDFHTTTAYPGYARAETSQVSNNRTSLSLEAAFQADPAGDTITRVSTGTQHQIASGWAASAPGVVTLNTPLDPPVVAGELFKLPLKVQANPSSTSFTSNVRFGGFHDVGNARLALSVTNAANKFTAASPAVSCAEYTVTQLAGADGTPVTLQCSTMHVVPGMRVEFTNAADDGPLSSKLGSNTAFFVTRTEYAAGVAPKFFVSATRFGAEVVHSAGSGSGSAAGVVARIPQHVNSTMAGLTIRFTSGALNGKSFPLTDNIEDSGNFKLQTDSTMSPAPSNNDTFEIEPERINNEKVEWDEYALFLPETTIPGAGYGAVNNTGAFVANSDAAAVFKVQLLNGVYEGMRFRVYDYEFNGVTRTVATGQSSLEPGKVLFAKNVSGNTCEVSLTYGGASLTGTASTGGADTDFTYAVEEHPDRVNPAPPGFNYDNTRTIPDFYYLPYFGEQVIPLVVDPNASMASSLARAMHEYTGRTIHVINTNIDGTSLVRREAADTTVALSHSWYDRQALLDWAPGESDNCYAHTVKMLRAAKRSAAAKGDTLKIVGIFFPQGETDAASEEHAARYQENLEALVKSLRAEVVSLGLWSGPAETLPWWQPQITANTTEWPHYETVNTAITTVAAEDDYFATDSVTDLLISYDGIHFRGDSVYEFGLKAFNSWKALAPDPDDRTRVDICNQALKNLGQTRTITSLTENTAAAKLCNRYYNVAVHSLLENFPWSFAVKTAKLTAKTTNDRLTVDWKHAYNLPANFLSVVTLGPDLGGATVDEEVTFAIENDTLYTNLADATLRYTQKSPDPRKYSQHFTNALAYKLAAEIAPGLFQGEQGIALTQSMMQLAEFSVDQARQHMGQRLRNAQEESNNYAWD